MRARSVSIVLVAAICLGGCASVRQTVGGWMSDPLGSDATTDASTEALPYFSAIDGLPVHAEASGGSAVVGRLAQYEKVTRTRLVSGWAYVTSDGGLTGWVDNAQLIWRLPAAAPAAPGSTAPTGPVPPAASSPGDAAAQPTVAPTAVPAVVAPDVPAPTPAAQPTAVPAPGAPAPAAAPVPDATDTTPPTTDAPAPTAAPRRSDPGMFDPY